MMIERQCRRTPPASGYNERQETMNFNFTSSGNRTYSHDDIRAVAPSVFAERPWQAMSEKYQFVPTIKIVEGMEAEGFRVVKAMQSKSRIEGKGDFTKHLLRFRRSDADLIVGDTFPEIILVNSHDGTSSYQLYAGLFRLACLNGMVCSIGKCSEYKTFHLGDIRGEVIDASYRIVQDFPQIADAVQSWKGKSLTVEQQTAFAESAALLRWDAEQERPSASQLLTVRRYDDRPDERSLWGTYNRVQEAVIKGGNRYEHRDDRGRLIQRRRTRAVTGIDQDVKLNKALWTLTEKMASLV